ncbi:extracellular solute-binding protein [Rhizobium sp. C4]|uniref:extracellular solute-binding protein n=1 Tax=Rhizobium sp. C4 TaxID=1349800 RepID=UPI001E44896A|nr:extracellular solute-binding protein [Rhizobium sp. C4]MCD2171399.1 extracellular solute-binding protein [Rhizobium sp. C4]
MAAVVQTAVFVLTATVSRAEPTHAIAMHGAPALPADFDHFPYADPKAPEGGSVTYGVVGTFDSLNPFVLKGMRTTARGLWDPQYGSLIFEPLMLRSADEPFTLYGLLAKSVEMDDDRTYLQFNLDSRARWSDGKPVTADDVIFTFELLRDHGRPPFSNRLKKVEKMEKVGENSVRFTFTKDADREFPMLLALSPVLPKHAIDPKKFEQSGLTQMIGSGPYLFDRVKPGEKIVYKRNPNYWANDLPAMRGLANYDRITINYYLQDQTLFEAFKKGDVDIYADGSPTHWRDSYNFPAVRSGDVVREEFMPKLPSGMFGFVFNTRRPLFQDVRVREALTLAFDFEWVNRNLFGEVYARTESFWQNSDLSSYGVPASEKELSLIGDLKKDMEPEFLDGSYRLPVTDGTGRDRKVLKRSVDLLKEAGYSIRDGKMVDGKGKPLTFEIMTQSPDQEKVALAYQRFLTAIGVDIVVRTVDDSSYQQRSQSFDYDMVLKSYSSSLSPGAEQIGRWGSASRSVQGTDSFAGVADPGIDRILATIVSARGQDDFIASIRALDRVLMSRYYVIPLYHIAQQWVAHRKNLAHPPVTPLYGYSLPAWWDETARAR